MSPDIRLPNLSLWSHDAIMRLVPVDRATLNQLRREAYVVMNPFRAASAAGPVEGFTPTSRSVAGGKTFRQRPTDC
jgi:hypothetical protein